jgi:hypothetical protein
MKPEILESLQHRVMLRIHDGMTEENMAAITDAAFDELCLLSGKFDDLSFFHNVSQKTEGLQITGAGQYDLIGIEQLNRLRFLRLETGAQLLPMKRQLNFGAFPNLESCLIYWRKEYSRNLFDCPKLSDLRMFTYDGKSLDELAHMESLEKLALTQSSIASLSGIESCHTITELDLAYLPKLADISAIRHLPKLQRFAIQNVKSLGLADFQPIFDVKSFEQLAIGAGYDLPNLEPFAQLTSLRQFITSSQVVNQNLSSLFGLKKLKLVRFIGLRNYVTSDEELQEMAKHAGRKLDVNIIGQGKTQQTVTLKFD